MERLEDSPFFFSLIQTKSGEDSPRSIRFAILVRTVAV
jgi:hypothetical protein